ncbi:MAG TPA: YicC/YloC family endoribonuclease [Gemmatimonadaceae bacterium]|nr:YicC/YloC family endoribonuclease [Gemmatimonadaceae bacterium]
MTGFGTAEGRVGSARVSVELRSVNHRFFNPSIKLPSPLTRWEGEVRELLRKRVSRGHVTLVARMEREASAVQLIDEDRFGRYVEVLRELQERHGLDGEIDVATVMRMPDVLGVAEADVVPDSAAALLEIVDRAATALTVMRGEEGSRLAAYLLERLEVIERALDSIAARAPKRLVEQRDRLRQAVRELTEGLATDEQRIAQEIALLADRLDVSEEMSRFQSHLAAFREALAEPPADGVGRRLGFLLQEMVREANTTGSKAADAAMLQDVVVIKEELERSREQVENLE